MVIALIIKLIIANVEAPGIQAAARVMGYENRLIDQSRVHVLDGWHGFIDTVENAEYSVCSQCGIAVRTPVLRRISRFIRSVTLFARIFVLCLVEACPKISPSKTCVPIPGNHQGRHVPGRRILRPHTVTNASIGEFQG